MATSLCILNILKNEFKQTKINLKLAIHTFLFLSYLHLSLFIFFLSLEVSLSITVAANGRFQFIEERPCGRVEPSGRQSLLS